MRCDQSSTRSAFQTAWNWRYSFCTIACWRMPQLQCAWIPTLPGRTRGSWKRAQPAFAAANSVITQREPTGLVRRLVRLHQVVDDADQLFGVDRFFKVVIREGIGGLKGLVDVAGDDHHGREGKISRGHDNVTSAGIA